MSIQIDFSLVLACYFFLVLFGIGYNMLISALEKNGYLEGFTSLAVAMGVAVTLTVLAVISWKAALLALGCFASSGGPMIAGSILRYVRSRRDAQLASRRVAVRIDMLGDVRRDEVADEVHP